MRTLNFLHLKHTSFLGFCLLIVGSALFTSCSEQDFKDNKGPYKDGPELLVEFKDARPEPEEGKVGSEVTYQVKGLNELSDFKFYINQVEAEVLSQSDSTITVKVPEKASSGAASIVSQNQTFFGPIFTVEGKVSIAISFDSYNGANREIKQILARPSGEEYFIVGNFTDYENNASSEPVNHLALIDYKGDYQSILQAEKGANGNINSIAMNPTNQKLFIGGTFTGYNIRRGMNNITRLTAEAALDSMIVDLINPEPDENPENDKDTVATFNGGLSGGSFPSVIKVFFDEDLNQIYTVGNYKEYRSAFYLRSTKGGLKIDYTAVNDFARLDLDGEIDSSFNFHPNPDKPGKMISYPGGNGFIADVVRTPDGDFVIVGNFTTYDEKEVNYIARIDGDDGHLDESFKTGTGADGAISKITYNKTTGKFLVTGSFHKFDGTEANGVVMLNSDGSVDPQFTFGETTKGRANYAGQLDNGLILVSGRFLTYNGVVRSGFMILEPDGSLAEGYNNTGAFVGRINQIMESETSDGDPGVIIVGDFGIFDNVKVGNIVKIGLKP